VTVKDLTEKSAAARDALRGTRELERVVVDDREQAPRFEYYRHTFADHTVEIGYKRLEADRLGQCAEKHESEATSTANPTTTPTQITIYKKAFLMMGIYELKDDKLKIAFHGISELERPRGFAVADKRISDLPQIVWEFKRKKTDVPGKFGIGPMRVGLVQPDMGLPLQDAHDLVAHVTIDSACCWEEVHGSTSRRVAGRCGPPQRGRGRGR
jgi:uncharacterized protein (TIGR03067 family)